MAKLYFRYGAMNSGKSTALMQVAHNYEERGMRVLIMKPSIDTKGGEKLMSRLGVERRVDIAVRPDMDPLALVRADIAKNGPLACVLTDESQFFTSWQAEQLFMVTVALNVPVICYGLRADFKGDLFPGSEALLVMADKIEEVKTICWCGKKALCNARFDESGHVIKEGEQVVLGANDQYIGLCRKPWMAGDLGPDFDIHKV